MTQHSSNTSLPKRGYQIRRWLSLVLFVMCVSALVQGLMSGCIEFSRVGIVDCRAESPVGYWLTLLVVTLVSFGLFGLFISSFGQSSEGVKESEDAKLQTWLELRGEVVQPFYQSARMLLLARIILLLFIVLVSLLLWRYEGFKDAMRFSLFLFMIVPSGIAVALLVQWLGLQIRVDEAGIQVYRVWAGWKARPWDKITHVKMAGDYVDRSYRVEIHYKHSRVIFTKVSVQSDAQHFLQITHWVLQECMKRDIKIQLPLDGLDSWIDGVSE
ncbi:MAG: hypothetical protein HOM11_11610 [Methylococcales bacterium]|jgi:hypothetical protein|nr:hypothetical protein [Methylococcales bacterium]MBT7445451.1 hypothetical protein [Methylococcales bacterium]